MRPLKNLQRPLITQIFKNDYTDLVRIIYLCNLDFYLWNQRFLTFSEI